MPKRPFRVLEIGVGESARKLVDLSLKPSHAAVEFVGVDARHVRYGKYLREKGLSLKPKNLQVRSRANAIPFLREQPDESFSHMYAHFTLEHIDYAGRQTLFHHVMRTLKPNATFAIVEDAPHSRQLKSELEKAGFVVHARRISSQELLRLGSEHSQLNVLEHIRAMQLFNFLPEKAPKWLKGLRGPKTRKEFEDSMVKWYRDVLRKKLMAILGNNSLEGQKAVQQILLDIPLYWSQKPFVVIRAKKPLKKS
jgi:hypothetical protein